MAQRRRSGESIKKLCGCAALLGLGAGLGFLPQLFVWGRYFGWFVRPKNIERLRPLAPALTEVLWSMRAGLFPWTPVAYLGIFGLGLGLVRGASRAAAGQEPEGEPNPRRLQGLLAAALAVLLSDVYLVAASWVWYGGFSFGARRLSDCAGILGLGVGAMRIKVSSISFTPKLFTALPKNTGLTFAFKYSCLSKSSYTPSINVISSRN